MPELSIKAIADLLEPIGGKLDAPSGVSLDSNIAQLVYDSRKVGPAVAFFCIPGEKTDGNLFVNDAIKSGAFDSLPVSSIMPAQLSRKL